MYTDLGMPRRGNCPDSTDGGTAPRCLNNSTSRKSSHTDYREGCLGDERPAKSALTKHTCVPRETRFLLRHTAPNDPDLRTRRHVGARESVVGAVPQTCLLGWSAGTGLQRIKKLFLTYRLVSILFLGGENPFTGQFSIAVILLFPAWLFSAHARPAG